MLLNKSCFVLLASAAVIGATGAPAARAATYYVGPTGSDGNPGTAASPWRTIQKAAATMVPGDTTLIADGDYWGAVKQTRAGTCAAPITFRAVHPGGPLLHGETGVTQDVFTINQAPYVVVDGLTIQRAPRCAIWVQMSNGVTVRRCRLLNNTWCGMLTGYSDDLLIEYNEAAYSVQQHGIYVSNSGDRPVVRYNVCHDNNYCGIQLNADPRQLQPSLGTRGDGIIDGALIECNTLYNNGKANKQALNLASVRNSRIVNNLLYNNYCIGIAAWDDNDGPAYGSVNNTVANNTVYSAPGTGSWCLSLKNYSTGNVVANNLFCGGAKGAIDYNASALPMASDYNLFFSANQAAVACNESLANSYQTMDQWRAATGNDLHTAIANPLFVSPTAVPPDFHLQASSPALGAGSGTVYVLVDKDGVSRPAHGRCDIGCYQRPAPAATVTLNATADAYVQSGTYADSNFGMQTTLGLKKSSTAPTCSLNRCAYLRFDLRGLTAAPRTATLALQQTSSTPGAAAPVRLYYVPEGTSPWVETTITWNNAPGLDRANVVGTGTLVGSSLVPLTPGPVSFDLTAFVGAHVGQVVTLQLIDEVADNLYTSFQGRHASTGVPVLGLTY